jgi:hypothetical protein
MRTRGQGLIEPLHVPLNLQNLARGSLSISRPVGVNGFDCCAGLCRAPLEGFNSGNEQADVTREAPGICSDAADKAAEFRGWAPIKSILDEFPHQPFDTQIAGASLPGSPKFAKNAHAADMTDQKPVAQFYEFIRSGLAAEKRQMRSAHEFRDREREQFACRQGTRRKI